MNNATYCKGRTSDKAKNRERSEFKHEKLPHLRDCFRNPEHRSSTKGECYTSATEFRFVQTPHRSFQSQRLERSGFGYPTPAELGFI